VEVERKSGPKKASNTTAKKLARLQQRLAELEQTLSAIQSGEVDALVVNGGKGEQVYALQSAEYPYRVLVEKMAEGALSLSTDGIILYSNASFARMVKSQPEELLATQISQYIRPESLSEFQGLLKNNAALPGPIWQPTRHSRVKRAASPW
jgi:PAS domain-containing protein